MCVLLKFAFFLFLLFTSKLCLWVVKVNLCSYSSLTFMALLKYIWWMYYNPSIFLLMDICSASNFFHMRKCASLKVFCLPPPILHLWQYPYSIYAEEELICGILCSSSNIFEPVMKVKVSCLPLCEHGLYVAHQAPRSTRFSRQEYCRRLSFPFPGYLPNPGIKPRSPTLQADSLPFEVPDEAQKWKLLGCVWLFVTPWTIQSVSFSRPEYWSG